MALVWTVTVLLVLITTLFAVNRVVEDSSNIRAGVVPPVDDISRAYAQHPVPAYLHIVPAVIFMVGAPLQFVPGIRRKHIRWHRRLGRVFLTSGIVAGIFAIVIGIMFPFGGPTETSATITFGLIFLFSLGKAFVHIRGKRVAAHREWMIRAFAIGLGVSTIRLWIPVFSIFTDMTFQEFFGIAFWVAFSMHAVIAEVWIHYTRGGRVATAGSGQA